MIQKKILLLALYILTASGHILAYVGVTVISPPDYYITDESAIKCRGVLASATDILITKLGTKITRTSLESVDSFDLTIPLDMGPNTIAIEIYENSKPQIIERRVFRQLNKRKAAELPDSIWSNFPSVTTTAIPAVKILESSVEPKALSIQAQTLCSLKIQITNPELVKEITADLSDLGWPSPGNIKFQKLNQGWYKAQGIILDETPLGVLRLPGIIKLYNGESVFTEFIAWVVP